MEGSWGKAGIRFVTLGSPPTLQLSRLLPMPKSAAQGQDKGHISELERNDLYGCGVVQFLHLFILICLQQIT